MRCKCGNTKLKLASKCKECHEEEIINDKVKDYLKRADKIAKNSNWKNVTSMQEIVEIAKMIQKESK